MFIEKVFTAHFSQRWRQLSPIVTKFVKVTVC